MPLLLTIFSCSANHHDHFALAPAVKLTKEDSLPATQQKLPVRERDSYRRSDEAGLDVRVRVFFAVMKAHAMLRNQSAEDVQHIPRHVRLGILVYRETGGGVLHVEHNDTFLLAGIRELFLHLFGKLNQLFALM